MRVAQEGSDIRQSRRGVAKAKVMCPVLVTRANLTASRVGVNGMEKELALRNTPGQHAEFAGDNVFLRECESKKHAMGFYSSVSPSHELLMYHVRV